MAEGDGERGEAVTVAKTLREVRETVLRAEAGHFIGSEDQLAKAYRVSRPTMRQIVVLLTQEGLLEARRGPGGGFFTKRPDATAITHNAIIYLRSEGTRSEEIIRAIEPIRTDMAVLAASNRDPAQIEIFERFRERDQKARAIGSFREFKITEGEFGDILGQACMNRVLKLFMETLLSVGNWDNLTERLLMGRPERFQEFWAHRNRCLNSIIEGDPFLTGVHCRRGLRLLTEWMQRDIAEGQRRGGETDLIHDLNFWNGERA